jgi:hypothetical protein
MNSHTRETKEPTQKEKDACIEDVQPTYVSVSDPEEDNSSGVESFDEDDIYDGSENGDEVIYRFPDSEAQSPVDSMVCPLLPSWSPDFSCHIV